MGDAQLDKTIPRTVQQQVPAKNAMTVVLRKIDPKLDLGLIEEIRRGRKCRMDVLKHLLNAGANPNAQAEDGWSALHLAVKEENRKACKFLLKNGANVNALTYGRSTPMLVAKFRGNNGIIRLLRKSGGESSEIFA
jgi:ankyrin repeat protein